MLPEIHLANLLTLPDGRTVESEAVGDGEPLLWIGGGPGLLPISPDPMSR
jgi:hypothetical protein